MNQCLSKSESLIQTPLLLRYKVRNCYAGTEAYISDNRIETESRDWTEYRDSGYEAWQLQLPGSDDFLLGPNRKALHFIRREFYAAGDPNPVLIWFEDNPNPDWFKSKSMREDSKVRICRLPVGYVATLSMYACGLLPPPIRSILCNYERCGRVWQTQTIVGEQEYYIGEGE